MEQGTGTETVQDIRISFCSQVLAQKIVNNSQIMAQKMVNISQILAQKMGNTIRYWHKR